MAYHFSNHSFSPPNPREVSEAGFSADDHYEGWKFKLIDYWSSYDTLFWLLSELYKLQVQNPATLKLEHFVNTRGCDLKNFSVEDFRKIIPQYGDILYHQLQTKLKSVMNEVWGREGMPQPTPGPSHPLHMAYFDQPQMPPHMPDTSTNHWPIDGPSTKHWPMDRPPTKHWPTDRPPTKHWPTDRPPTKHWPTDRPPTKHWPTERPPSKHWPTESPSTKHWPIERRIYDCWAYKSISEWSPSDTLDCFIHELFQLNINPASVSLNNFRDVSGRDLVRMTLDDFKLRLPECGELLYHHLQLKIRSNSQSELVWSRTHENQVISNQSINQEFSYAHRQEIPYAHPSCFRWKPEVFPGGSADNDTVLNLSREHTSTSACDLSITSVSLPASSSVSSSQSTSFEPAPTVSKSQCSVSKSNFSILNLTKDCVKHTSSVIKQENESDPLPPDTAETIAQEVECSPQRPASRDSCCVENTQDSVASAADSEHTKGVEGSAMDHGYNSETNDEIQSDQEESYKKVKRKPGRPRSLHKKDKVKGKVGRVWEFIRDLIMDPKYNPKVISWEDREKGLFRFRSGDQVAKLWGCKRGNPRMNFENFSRSIRQNYKKGYLLPVEKIRLVYQFGPRSTGWRPGDPPTKPVTLPSNTPSPSAAAAATTVAQ
ncbi:protein C-ets-2-like [Macrosteles quadrilineatus]|uniref:protein C-ets-2-like n=1 Tax=Macrosteles quadrilineatus TaxID=74068 RepID=UPI0023E0ABDF|nr:protein C-ets-2-like [Macrosteles quadrilineatus]